MQKTRVLILGITISLVLIIGIVGLKRKSERSPDPGRFKWGVVLHPNAQLQLVDRVIDEQMRLAKALGVTWIKTDHIDRLGPEYNDTIVAAAKKHRLGLMFIIDWQLQDIEPFNEEQIETRAFDAAFKISKRYKGVVPYYQISSEPGGLVLKSPLLPGIEASDYDRVRYEKIFLWLRGTLRGIRDADPSARSVMVGQFVHTGFFDLIEEDGLLPLFDTIGWDLYSDVADDPQLVKWDGKEFQLLEKLKGFKKELILTEVARRDGTSDGNERAVGEYYQRVAGNLGESGINGFFAYELLDQPAVAGTQADYGLVRLEENPDGSFRIGKKKAGFGVYRRIIRGELD